MVKVLSQGEQQKIEELISLIQCETPAKIKVIVVRASDRYQEYIVLFGLILGAFASLGLWAVNVVQFFPWLLLVQLIILLLVERIPFVHSFCIRCLPASIQRQKSAHRAYSEYYVLHAPFAPTTPFVLLYVSVIERYIHIITNPLVHKTIPLYWDVMKDQFLLSAQQEGIGSACLKTVHEIGEILKKNFKNPS